MTLSEKFAIVLFMHYEAHKIKPQEMPRVRDKFPARAVHLIDIENLVGAPRLTKQAVTIARYRYLAEISVGAGDHVIIATSSSQNLLAAAQGWPGARYLQKPGKDGADLMLAEVIANENLESRFKSAIIASGDGGLAPSVAHLASRGVATTAVAHSQSLSHKMRLAAHASVIFAADHQLVA